MRRLLVVDDEAADLMLVRRAVGKHAPGFEVCTSTGGEDAIRKIDPEQADLVLLDINMPGLDGFEVLRAARQGRPSHLPPVIMFSTSDRPTDVERAYAEGASAYVVKPSTLEGYRSLATAIDAFWGQVVTTPSDGQ